MALGKLLGWLRGKNELGRLSDELWDQTLDRLPFIDRLNAGDKLRLRQLTEDFLDGKEFAAAGGLELTDAICASIAVQGCLPILNLGLSAYRDWVGIVVYPDEFVIPRTVEDEFGIVHEYDDLASGEAWEGGPLLISWHDVQMAGDGYNVVIHEFAHKLDMLNGEADGIPPLPAEIPRTEWEKTMLAAYDDFSARVEALENESGSPEKDLELPIDPYAAEHPAEFFAVLTECFFETPEIFIDMYPELFSLFCKFYRQHPEVGARIPEGVTGPSRDS